MFLKETKYEKHQEVFKISKFASHLTLDFKNIYKIKMVFYIKTTQASTVEKNKVSGGAGNSIASRVFSKFPTL